MKNAKWIWLNTVEKADEYAVFYDEFVYESGTAQADISVAGDYALYINCIVHLTLRVVGVLSKRN